jgi:hypothetical protein
MKKSVSPACVLLAVLLLWLPVAHAQELQLFEPVETSGQPGEIDAVQGDVQTQMALPTTPAFTLVGTSRIGGRQRATLASSTGQILHVEIRDGEDAPIDGFPGYRLVSVNSRRAEISLPSGMPCVGARAQGVSCGTDGLAQLSLTTAAPVPVAAPTIAAEATGEPAVAEANGDVAADNPFAAALRAAAQNERAAGDGQRGPFNAERFQPRRIAPEDVPPGMRVVRTPFGDRLVEL